MINSIYIINYSVNLCLLRNDYLKNISGFYWPEELVDLQADWTGFDARNCYSMAHDEPGCDQWLLSHWFIVERPLIY